MMQKRKASEFTESGGARARRAGVHPEKATEHFLGVTGNPGLPPISENGAAYVTRTRDPIITNLATKFDFRHICHMLKSTLDHFFSSAPRATQSDFALLFGCSLPKAHNFNAASQSDLRQTSNNGWYWETPLRCVMAAIGENGRARHRPRSGGNLALRRSMRFSKVQFSRQFCLA
jgi:hypothetical protein